MFKDKNPENNNNNRARRIRAVAAGIAMAILPASCAVEKVDDTPKRAETEQVDTTQKHAETTQVTETTSAEKYKDSKDFYESPARNKEVEDVVQKASKSLISHSTEYGQWKFNPLTHTEDITDPSAGLWGYWQNDPASAPADSGNVGASYAFIGFKAPDVDYRTLDGVDLSADLIDQKAGFLGLNVIRDGYNINAVRSDVEMLEHASHAGHEGHMSDMDMQQGTVWVTNSDRPEAPGVVVDISPDLPLDQNELINQSFLDLASMATN